MLKVQQTQHRFLSDAVNQIQDDDPESADVVIIGPPTGDLYSDLENEDNKILNTTGLPKKSLEKLKSSNLGKMKLREWLLMVKIAMWIHHWRRNKNKILKTPSNF